MAVSTLVATAGASNANTYCTRAESTQYDDDNPQSGTTWSGASNDLKDQSLLMATRLLDEHLDWTGAPSDTVQVLNWPRTGMWDRNGNFMDSDSIPNDVRDATAEFARQIIAADRMADDAVSTKGITNLQAGPVSLTFSGKKGAKVVPDAVYYMLESSWFWAVRKRGQMTADLVRT
tara:strand:+ start:3800 stop:4327 length:528 start_codon:yes stop_codon:yes gene_type:complete